MPNPSRAGLAARWVVSALLLVQGTASFAADPRASRLYEDALQRFEAKDHAGAVVQLKNALQIDKSLLQVHVLLGKALLAQNQPSAAEAALVEALRLGVSREEVVVPLARAALDTGKARAVVDDERFSEKDLSASTRFQLLLLKAGGADDAGERKIALQLLEKARSIDASSPETWMSEARLRVRSGQLREAQTAADKAVSLGAGQAAPLYVRGTVAHTQGDLKSALSFYDKALQIDPTYVEGLVSRAGLLLDLNRAADAAKDTQALLKADPNDARGHYMTALLAEREGKTAEAKAALQRVTEQLDRIPIEALRYRPQLLMLGGLAHFGLNQTEKAKPYLEGVLREQPSSPAAKLLARIHLKEANFPRAIEALEGYRRQLPNDPQATLLLASAHMAEGRHARAIALLQAAQQQQARPEYQQALGMAFMKSGQFKSAVSELEAAYKANPRADGVGIALASLYLQLGQPSAAVKVAEQLTKDLKDPPPGLAFLLGKARREAGDLKGARAPLEAAAKADPRFLDPQLELAKIELQSGAAAEAKTRLAAALERDPKHVGLLSLLGQVMVSEGRLDEAQRWFEKADDHSPRDVVDHGLRLIEFHLAQGKVDKAREVMQQRVQSKLPDATRVLITLARIDLAAGDRRAAKSTLARASSAVPVDIGALLAIAELQLAAEDVPGAAHSASKALKESPQNTAVQVMVARTDILLNNLPAAEQRARELTARLPKSGIGHSLLGEVAAARNQEAAATASFKRAHDLDNSRATLLRLVGHLERSQVAESMRITEQWLKKHPNDPVAWRFLADAQARAGDWANARRSYETLLKATPDDAEALNNLVHVQLALKDPAALKTAERAYALKPAAAHIIGTLGWAAHKAGQNDRALQLLRDARLRNPDSSETRYYLGAALAAQGRNGEAKTELVAALKSPRAFSAKKDAQALLDTLN